MISVVSQENAFQELEGTWNELYNAADAMTPFQSFAYNWNSWQFSHGKKDSLHIVVVIRQKDKLVQAIFPCYIDGKGALRFVNDRDSDFCGPIIHKGFVGDYHVYEEFSDHVKAQKEIHHVRFENLVAQNAVLGYLRYFFTGAVVYNNNAYSILQIEQRKGDDHFTKALPVLNATERNRIKKVYNKLKISTFVRFDGDVDYPEKELEILMQSMVEAGIREMDYQKTFVPLLKTLYKEKMLLIGVTYLDGQPLAANIFLKGENEYINWLVFYTDKQYNLWNVLQHIEYFSETGAVLNFARGLYEYKMRNFRPVIYTLYSLRYSASTLGTLNDIRYVGWHFFRKLVKRIITNRKG